MGELQDNFACLPLYKIQQDMTYKTKKKYKVVNNQQKDADEDSSSQWPNKPITNSTQFQLSRKQQ